MATPLKYRVAFYLQYIYIDYNVGGGNDMKRRVGTCFQCRENDIFRVEGDLVPLLISYQVIWVGRCSNCISRNVYRLRQHDILSFLKSLFPNKEPNELKVLSLDTTEDLIAT